MMKASRITLLLLIATWGSCGVNVPRHEEFVVGMSRADITARFGEPERTQNLTKSDDSIWGPIEGFWPKVPMGAAVEIWAFQSAMTLESPERSSEQPGQTELYFVNDSDTVDGIGFHIEGAVYEGS